MTVEDKSKQNQCYFRYTAWLKRPNFWVHVSPGSAETLASAGGITNQHLIAYSLSNISAKNYQNRSMCVEVIVCYIIVVFWRHGVELSVVTIIDSVGTTSFAWNSGVTNPNLTKFSRLVQKWLPINLLKPELWYSNPFQNASMPNERISSNFGRVAAQFLIFYPL